MRKLLILALLLSLGCGTAQYASAQNKPKWTDGYFVEKSNSYIEVVSATGPDEESARNKAAANAIERRSLSTGKRVQVIVRGDAVQVQGDDALTVKSRIIDEYTEHPGPGEYRVYLLMQTAKNPSFEFEPVRVSANYEFSPRVFVPGLAQLHKGSKVKGGLIIAGEAAFIGGIIFSESMRASYNSKINTTHDASLRQDYIDKADMYENTRNIMIGGAAILYVYNVIDGIAAKGDKHVVFGCNNLKIAPYATADNAGIYLSLKF